MKKENLRFENIVLGLSEFAFGAMGSLYVLNEVLKVNPVMAGVLILATIKLMVDGGRNIGLK